MFRILFLRTILTFRTAINRLIFPNTFKRLTRLATSTCFLFNSLNFSKRLFNLLFNFRVFAMRALFLRFRLAFLLFSRNFRPRPFLDRVPEPVLGFGRVYGPFPIM